MIVRIIILTTLYSCIATTLDQYVLLDVHLTELFWFLATVLSIVCTDLRLSAEGVQLETSNLGSHAEFLFLLSVVTFTAILIMISLVATQTIARAE